MGRLHRVLILAALSVFTQACSSTGAPQSTVATQDNTLSHAFHRPSAVDALTPDAVESVDSYGDQALSTECQRESWLGWCDKPLPQLQTRALPISQISRISHAVQNGYVYKSDVVDSWNSFSASQLAGITWYGDCDDLTSTTLDMLFRSGQPLNKMWMLLNDVESHGILDHIVGVVQASDGKYYIVGDTSPTNVYPLAHFKYSPRGVVRLDQRHKWVSALDSPLFANYQYILKA